MIPYGIGTDILEIARVRESIERHGQAFLDKIFTRSEQAYCQKHRDPMPQYAARFSAKESVVKALGCGFGDKIGFLDIEISHDPLGKPLVHLSPSVKESFKHPNIIISMSHCKEYVSTIALLIHN